MAGENQAPKFSKMPSNKLDVEAKDAVYIGDSPIEDIKGAKQAGLKTIFVPSQFNTLKDLIESNKNQISSAKDIQSILGHFAEIIEK